MKSVIDRMFKYKFKLTFHAISYDPVFCVTPAITFKFFERKGNRVGQWYLSLQWLSFSIGFGAFFWEENSDASI